MANLQRLILFNILFLFIFSNAQAALIWKVNNDSRYQGSTPESACASYLAYQHTQDERVNYIGIEPVGDGYFCLTNTYGNGPVRLGSASSEIVVDPTCTPPQRLDPATSTCVDPPNPCVANKKDSNFEKRFNVPHDVDTLCISGCSYSTLDGLCAGDYGCAFGAGRQNGSQCTTTDAKLIPPPQPATDPTPVPPKVTQNQCLASGNSFGNVNGVDVCIPRALAGATPTTSKADETTTTTSNGSTSTDKVAITTSVADGKVTTTKTTTTTTTAADGTVATATKTEAKQQDSNNFCKDNPNATICKEAQKSEFGGACDRFSCKGDAIQCAIAKEQHNRNCALFEKKTALSDKGQSMIDGNDDGSLTNPAKDGNREVVNVGGMVSEGSNIGGGQFTDTVISMPHGGNVTLPFSKLNFVMQILGTFLLAGAYINAARIVGVR